MAFVRVNDIVLHYRDDGPVGAPVLVMSNSLGTDLRIWDEFVASYPGCCRIIRYDKRGHGLSQATPAPYSLNDHVGDLAALLDHLGVAQVALIGLSVGGMIAQQLAATRPDLVAALVVCDSAHRIGTAAQWNERIEAVTRNGVASIADAILERWFTPPFRSQDNAAFVGYAAMLARCDADGYTGTCAALRDADLTASTQALKLPVLCLCGDQDSATPPDLVRQTCGLIEGARFELITGAGHLPCIEQPDATARLIAEFLQEANHH